MNTGNEPSFRTWLPARNPIISDSSIIFSQLLIHRWPASISPWSCAFATMRQQASVADKEIMSKRLFQSCSNGAANAAFSLETQRGGSQTSDERKARRIQTVLGPMRNEKLFLNRHHLPYGQPSP